MFGKNSVWQFWTFNNPFPSHFIQKVQKWNQVCIKFDILFIDINFKVYFRLLQNQSIMKMIFEISQKSKKNRLRNVFWVFFAFILSIFKPKKKKKLINQTWHHFGLQHTWEQNKSQWNQKMNKKIDYKHQHAFPFWSPTKVLSSPNLV